MAQSPNQQQAPISPVRTPSDFVWRPLPHEKAALPFLTRFSLAMQIGATGLTAITPEVNPVLTTIIDATSQRAGIAAPKAYFLEAQKQIPNAFATMGSTPCMMYTRPITQILNAEELAAVTAHELGHTKDAKKFAGASAFASIGGAALAVFSTSPLRRLIRGEEKLIGYRDLVRKEPSGLQKLGTKAIWLTAAYMGSRIGSAAVTRLEETSADRHTAIVMNDANETALVSALLKVTASFPRQNIELTGWQKAKMTILKPYYEAIQDHPTVPQRAADMGVTVEQVQAFQLAHANDLTVAQMEPAMMAATVLPQIPVEEPGKVKSFVSKVATRASGMHSFGHESNGSWMETVSASRAAAPLQEIKR